VFGIVTAFCDCSLKKKIGFKKSILVVVSWVKICIWLKLQLKLLLNKKQLKGVCLKLLLKLLLIIK
jgi:hypothetical protein